MRTLSAIRPALLLAVAALTLAAGCASGAGASPPRGSPSAAASATAGASASASDVEEPSPTEAGMSVDPSLVPASVLGPIVADAATRAGVDVSELVVVHAAPVEFNDGSLGCPEPGMGYTQAIVPGYQVIVEHDGAQLDYRASGPGAFRLCPEGGEPFPGDY
jgi:hypothetical protein